METILVIVIVGLAAVYLFCRYRKKTRSSVTCGCENAECPLNTHGTKTQGHACDIEKCGIKKEKP